MYKDGFTALPDIDKCPWFVIHTAMYSFLINCSEGLMTSVWTNEIDTCKTASNILFVQICSFYFYSE